MHVIYLSNAARTAQQLRPSLGAQPIAELWLGIQKQRPRDTLGQPDTLLDPPVRCDTMWRSSPATRRAHHVRGSRHRLRGRRQPTRRPHYKT